MVVRLLVVVRGGSPPQPYDVTAVPFFPRPPPSPDPRSGGPPSGAVGAGCASGQGDPQGARGSPRHRPASIRRSPLDGVPALVLRQRGVRAGPVRPRRAGRRR